MFKVAITYTYEEARKLILKHLKGKNLTDFCKENKIPYQQVMNFKRNPKIHYHSLAKSMLNSIGIKVNKIEKVTLYYISNK